MLPPRPPPCLASPPFLAGSRCFSLLIALPRFDEPLGPFGISTPGLGLIAGQENSRRRFRFRLFLTNLSELSRLADTLRHQAARPNLGIHVSLEGRKNAKLARQRSTLQLSFSAGAATEIASGTIQASNGVSGPSSPSIDTRIFGFVSIPILFPLNSHTVSSRDATLNALAR